MPRFDGTGPMGRGPLTGWGRGLCNWFEDTRFGPRFCRWLGWDQPATKDNLKDYKKDLETELKKVEKELDNYK